MGVVNSKSPLERRNTVLRRSQRKSIHGIKSKADKLVKDIKKFKDSEKNVAYTELKARIETAERELRHNGKTLQPQLRIIYIETLKKVEACQQLLDDKLKENREKQKSEPKEPENDDLFFDETVEEEAEARELEESKDKRKTVELNLVQVQPIEASPQINKRMSAMKFGVPVMPGSIMEAMHRKTQEYESVHDVGEGKIARIRNEIANLEMEISHFVGKKNGKFYNKIKGQLESYSKDLDTVVAVDDAIAEQIKLCASYIGSCMSFLDEKAVDDSDDVDGDGDDFEEPVPPYLEQTGPPETNIVDNFSPRTMRTTYI